MEPGLGYDGVSYSLSIICLARTLVLGFNSRDTLLSWDARVRYSLGEGQWSDLVWRQRPCSQMWCRKDHGGGYWHIPGSCIKVGVGCFLCVSSTRVCLSCLLWPAVPSVFVHQSEGGRFNPHSPQSSSEVSLSKLLNPSLLTGNLKGPPLLRDGQKPWRISPSWHLHWCWISIST